MTYEEISSMVEEIGLPCAYDHFAEGESPEPPFVVFILYTTSNFFADNKVYAKIVNVDIELYTDKKSPDIEHVIENILDAHEITWEMDEVWITQERLFQVRYTFDTFYEWEDEEETEDTTEEDDNQDDSNAGGDVRKGAAWD